MQKLIFTEVVVVTQSVKPRLVNVRLEIVLHIYEQITRNYKNLRLNNKVFTFSTPETHLWFFQHSFAIFQYFFEYVSQLELISSRSRLITNVTFSKMCPKLLNTPYIAVAASLRHGISDALFSKLGCGGVLL